MTAESSVVVHTDQDWHYKVEADDIDRARAYAEKLVRARTPIGRRLNASRLAKLVEPEIRMEVDDTVDGYWPCFSSATEIAIEMTTGE